MVTKTLAMAPRLARLASLASLALAADVGQKVCKPASSRGFPGAAPGRTVELPWVSLQLDRWDATLQRYVPQGLISAHTVHDDEFSAMTHGPKIRRADVKARDRSRAPDEFAHSLPPVYFTGTISDKLWLLDSVNASSAPLGSAQGGAWSAELKMIGYSVAPSTVYPIEEEDGAGNEQLNGFLIAGGNPFVMDPGNHSMQMNLGGITYMSGDGCKRLFPVLPDPYALTGRVMNTIDCHKRTGMCFFSAWKFDGQGRGLPLPDCLWYCKPDNLKNPTKCLHTAVMKDETGKPICRDYHLGGGVHGLTVMHDDPVDPNSFELLLVFTAGTGYEKGASWMSMLKVSVSDDGAEAVTRSQRLWGASLWNDTVAKPMDVGCDHATLDDAGRVWVSTFRTPNAGIHMLDYNGSLLYSIHGFGDHTPGQYSYPAGVSGFGTLFQQNSMMALATSAEKFGVPVMGVATVFLIDISKVITSGEGLP